MFVKIAFYYYITLLCLHLSVSWANTSCVQKETCCQWLRLRINMCAYGVCTSLCMQHVWKYMSAEGLWHNQFKSIFDKKLHICPIYYRAFACIVKAQQFTFILTEINRLFSYHCILVQTGHSVQPFSSLWLSEDQLLSEAACFCALVKCKWKAP